MEKLKRQLAEAEAAVEARKKPPPETGPRGIGEGLVIDEWVRTSNIFIGFILKTFVSNFHKKNSDQKERREKYLAQQQVEAVESV